AHHARLTGNTILKRNDETIRADQADLDLAKSGGGANRLEKLVAEGNVVVQQPARKATGTQLVYQSAEAKYVLTGTKSDPPSIFDAEHGTVSGDSLTFFSHDDRVLVESDENHRTVTQTRV